MLVFFDPSALVKRYIPEAGTDAVLQGCNQASEIALSGIALRLFRPFAVCAGKKKSPTRNTGN
jgi:hypothetical protein